MASYFANKQIDGFIAKPCDPADLLTPGTLTTVLQSATVAGPAIDVTGDFDLPPSSEREP